MGELFNGFELKFMVLIFSTVSTYLHFSDYEKLFVNCAHEINELTNEQILLTFRLNLDG